MEKGNIVRLLKAYKDLEDNAFWGYFMDQIDREKIRIALNSMNTESLTLEAMKFNQGEYSGYHLAKVLPSEIVQTLKEELEDMEANQ